LSDFHARVLVVDDDKAVRAALRVNLEKAGLDVRLASSAEEGLQVLHDHPMDIVLTDVKMPGASGIELLQEVKSRWPDVQVVVMTGQGTVEDAVRAMKQGAADYIIKPVSKEELLVVLDKAAREKALLAEVEQLRQEVQDRYGFENVVGVTSAMREVYDLVATVASSSALVLLTGPTGTGKELIAHAIHYRSPRRDAPFVRVNCAALPEGLMESELFGHEKGAFTGAIRQHTGKFEQADGGTILLDEIGEVPLATQVKLLRVLESGELQRVGGSQTIKVDVRVIAATNRELRREVKEGHFREDLFYRLNVFHIPMPPLVERRDDVPLLAQHFVDKYAARHNKAAKRLTAEALELLVGYHWPGNVRELEHVIERAVIVATSEDISHVRLPELDPDEAREAAERGMLPAGATINAVLDETERRLIIEALKIEKGVQARAARRLGISKSNLNYRINKLGISVRDVVYD
jgi:two-component system, NtrC family, response regulator